MIKIKQVIFVTLFSVMGILSGIYLTPSTVQAGDACDGSYCSYINGCQDGDIEGNTCDAGPPCSNDTSCGDDEDDDVGIYPRIF